MMRLRLMVLFAGLMAAPMAAQAQVIVDSPSEDIALLKDYIQDLKTWVLDNTEALSEAHTDIQTAQIYLQELQTYLAWVENPLLGAQGLLNLVGLGSDLPLNPIQMAQLVNGLANVGHGGSFTLNGALSELRMVSSYASSAFNTHNVYTCPGADRACVDMNNRASGIAGAMGLNQSAYGNIASHTATVTSLRADLAGETTPAKRETIQAQLQAESAWSMNMQASSMQTATQATLSAQMAQQRTLQVQRQSADQLFNDTQSIAGMDVPGAVTAANVPSPYPTTGP